MDSLDDALLFRCDLVIRIKEEADGYFHLLIILLDLFILVRILILDVPACGL